MHLTCSNCATDHAIDQLQRTCRECGRPLMVRYDVDDVDPDSFPDPDAPGMWRYHELLPLAPDEAAYLGEGWTPLLEADTLGAELGVDLRVKDEGQNPTTTFKDRGQAVAVPRAVQLGAEGIVLPTAGNAGCAAAAYSARAGVPMRAYVPSDTPDGILERMAGYGADIVEVDGLIDDCGKQAAAFADEHGYFDVSTLKEPYRAEGKKTMGFEIHDQLDGLPDAIVYPTGGGTGIVGMWKAFDELEQLGRIGSERPKMFSVQSTGCAPVVRAIEQGLDEVPRWEDAETDASGLRVPGLIGDLLVLEALRDSGGGAVAVPDDAMREAMQDLGAREGISACLEGAATLAGLRELRELGDVAEGEQVVLFNTGRGA